MKVDLTVKMIGHGVGVLAGMALSAICGNEFEKLAPKAFENIQKDLKKIKIF